MKRWLKLLWVAWIPFVACPLPEAPNTIIETIQAKGEIIGKKVTEDGDTVILFRNAIHDTLLDNVIKWIADGTCGDGGAEYFWVWHNEDGSAQWNQVTTTDESGGGDTSATLVMTGTYTADVGIVYDSCTRFRLGYASYFYSGSSSDTGYVRKFYSEHNSDTFALEATDQLIIVWTMAFTGSGTISDTMLWHICDGYQSDGCEAIDSIMLVYKVSGDSNTLLASKNRDYPGDTLTLTVTDTAFGAVDTVIRAICKDEDGTWMTNAVCEIHVASGATPIITYKIAVIETP